MDAMTSLKWSIRWLHDTILEFSSKVDESQWPGLENSPNRLNKALDIAHSIYNTVTSSILEGTGDTVMAIMQQQQRLPAVDNDNVVLVSCQVENTAWAIYLLTSAEPESAYFMLDLLDRYISPNHHQKAHWIENMSKYPEYILAQLFAKNADLALVVWTTRCFRTHGFLNHNLFGIEFVTKMIPLAKKQESVSMALDACIDHFTGIDIYRLLEAWQNPLFPDEMQALSGILGEYSMSALSLRVAFGMEKRQWGVDRFYRDRFNHYIGAHTRTLSETKTTTSKIASIVKTFPAWTPFGRDHIDTITSFDSNLLKEIHKHVRIQGPCRLVFDFL